jgi:hypothetical protein
MKETPEEIKMYNNFLAGGISKEGFLGDDSRHIHDIIHEDLKTLQSYQLTQQDAANTLQKLLDEGKKGLETELKRENFRFRTQWDRGMLPCPFGHKGLYPKIVVTIQMFDLSMTIKYSQISVHMIREHGFFGGKGSVFRIDPEVIYKLNKVMKRTIS